MTRPVIIALLISLTAAPAFAKGGGSDIQHEREKIRAEQEKARGKPVQPSPSLFDLFFGGDKKAKQQSK